MVTIKACLQKMNLITLFYTKADREERLSKMIVQNIRPIFYGTYEMIQQQTLVLTLMDMLDYTYQYNNHVTPEAEPR